MRILAIETATSLGSVALLDGDEVVREITERVPQRHLEWLAPAVAGVLEASGWRPGDVQGVVVSRGPGTFTGLRIGIATAAAWAYACSVPVVGVSTLEVLATGTAASGTAGLICPILDARREEFAFALFDAGRAVSRVLDDTVGPIGALLDRMPDGPVTFTGDGVPRIVEALRERPGWRSAPEISWYPRAVVTGAVGLRRLTRGEADEPYLLRPVYARAAGITQPAQSVLPEAGEETSETAGEE
jgi:tRNA threonylcarbamoyladenosine biosynthesis protein TsaB